MAARRRSPLSLEWMGPYCLLRMQEVLAQLLVASAYSCTWTCRKAQVARIGSDCAISQRKFEMVWSPAVWIRLADEF